MNLSASFAAWRVEQSLRLLLTMSNLTVVIGNNF
jgi:hypothetical protein